MKKTLIMLVVLGVMGIASNGFAKSKYKKSTIIDLSGAMIEGDLDRPEGSYLVSTKSSKFGSMIEVRSTYLNELLRSSSNL